MSNPAIVLWSTNVEKLISTILDRMIRGIRKIYAKIFLLTLENFSRCSKILLEVSLRLPVKIDIFALAIDVVSINIQSIYN
jgi:hypothetical protein